MAFEPFSLAKSIQAGQAIRMNQLKIQQAEAGMARQGRLRGLAQMSVRPTYGEAEGPPEISGAMPQIQTGTEYDPQAHLQGLQAAGEMDMAAQLQEQIGKMSKAQREEADYNATEFAQLIMSAKGNPDVWDQNSQIAVERGHITQEEVVPYSDEVWQRAMNDVQKVSNMLKADKPEMVELTKLQKTRTGLSQNELTPDAVKQIGEIDDRIAKITAVAGEGVKGRSEFERHLSSLIKSENLTPEQGLELARKRVGVLSGAERTLHQELSASEKITKFTNEATRKMRKEATEGAEHFSDMNKSIQGAIAAMESGDDALSDKWLAQALSQMSPTNKVRAYQMYKEFDVSFGNVAERTIRGISRFVSGGRSDTEKAEILETLKNFQESHSAPALNKIKNMYRDLARGDNLDPFKVVPPTSPEEIRDYPGMLKAEKLRLLKLYYPEKFQ